MIVFELVSEDLSGLGGQMGTEEPSTNWRRLYASLTKAKAAAKKNWERERAENDEKAIKWTYTSSESEWDSQDLRFVMYHIKKITVK